MDLGTLIEPVLSRLCEYCTFKNSGYEVPQQVILSEIRAELKTIDQRCATMPILYQQYQAIEKPLIFFIDYTIKEGNFSFSRDYKELARGFNELSGDEKFFDLLNNALKLNDDKEVIRMFYLMQGLGFDGYLKRTPSDALDMMHKTSGFLPAMPNFNQENITPDIDLPGPGKESEKKDSRYRKFFSRQGSWIAVCGVIAALSFLANYLALGNALSEFSGAVNAAVESLRPYEANQSYVPEKGEQNESRENEK